MKKQSSQSLANLTARRFFRNRLAVFGLGILLFMFLFSFLGGAVSPYSQDQVFYRDEQQVKELAGVTRNESYRFAAGDSSAFSTVVQALFARYLGKQDSFTHENKTYEIRLEGQNFYGLYTQGKLVGIAFLDILSPAGSFGFTYAALKAYCNSRPDFLFDGKTYALDPQGSIYSEDEEVGFISRLIIRGTQGQTEFDPAFRLAVSQAINQGQPTFQGPEGQQYSLFYNAAGRLWSVRQVSLTRVWDSYAPPSRTHLLGTDKNGMDMLTRLMYGGRISLVIGFLVVLISAFLGVIFGGIAGYFGSWTDNLIMRLVDIFYCVPSTPLLIILGAVMDGLRIDPQLRMVGLMLILGLLGWPGIARLVRGQILSLREQEFMTAAEALGLRTSRRIFRHLLPNVIPQLIVTCTMSLGSTILTEATLSFLGLGVKFPFASWGNIINDAANAHVLTSYWFVWIPAGVCLVLSVLGFNFLGDGLRDAFDPKMRR